MLIACNGFKDCTKVVTNYSLMKNLKFYSLVVLGALVFLSFYSNTAKSTLGLEVGDKIPNIKTASIDGKPFDLKNLKGKMVVVDFWASYDASSRIENFEKSNLIKKFKTEKFINGDGLSVVSISFDRFKSPLKQAIDRDGLGEATHICDYKGVDSELAHAFTTSTPIHFLVDGNGFIVAKSSHVADITAKLKSLTRL